MAWTKAKTAIVVSAGVLLAAGTTAVALYRANQPLQDIPRDWSVLCGESEQWNWSSNAINGHTITGDSILASDKEYRDATLSAVVGTTNREASLVFRMQDARNGYLVVFVPAFPGDNSSGRVTLIKRVDDHEEDLANYRGRIFDSLGQSAKIAVMARGPLVEVRLNDVRVIRVMDTTFSRGLIGFRIYGWGDHPCDATFSRVTF